MKSRNNNKPISQIISKLIKNPKLNERLQKLDALDIWNEIIGENLRKYIIESTVKEGVLIIKLNSPALRNELSYQKTDIINKINKGLGKKYLLDLKIK